MSRLIFRQGLEMVLIVFGVSTILFFAMRSTGDPAAVIAGPNASGEQVEAIRQQLGLTAPLMTQYRTFLIDLVHFRFGDSLLLQVPAVRLVLEALVPSLVLVGVSIVVTVCVAVPLGVVAAVNRNSPLDGAVRFVVLLGQSMPPYWLGLLLILVFAVKLRVTPSFGYGDARHLILPAVTLSMFLLAKLVRLTRANVLEVLGRDFVRTARAKGLSEMSVMFKHALRNALVPVIIIIAVDFGQLFGGAVIVETIFSWPGLGQRLVQSVLSRDFPVIQATVFLIALIVTVSNTLAEVLARLVDPRLRA
ncbi:MAG: ABC transporter permease [Candidatus Rokubacteria bacterium]|nr:ABC transporter permease [Candidatus Rokubacteria bacterium]